MYSDVQEPWAEKIIPLKEEVGRERNVGPSFMPRFPPSGRSQGWVGWLIRVIEWESAVVGETRWAR